MLLSRGGGFRRGVGSNNVPVQHDSEFRGNSLVARYKSMVPRSVNQQSSDFGNNSQQECFKPATYETQQQNIQSFGTKRFDSNTQQHGFGAPNTDRTQEFLRDMWSMYEQGIHDAEIKVGKTEFKILKSQFMAHSEVFKQMFSLNFKERETCTVEIKDVSEQAMKQLIKWMYTCQIEDESPIEDLFEAADKYQVNLLKTHCVELMISSLDNSNVFRRLILAVAHNDKQLRDATLDKIDKMPGMEMAVYVTSSEWFELGQKKAVFVKEVNKLISDKLKK